jgi:hypothetical protein
MSLDSLRNQAISRFDPVSSVLSAMGMLQQQPTTAMLSLMKFVSH